MPDLSDSNRNVDRFLLDQIDTVPHLEALLLLWKSRPKVWSADEMASALYWPPSPQRQFWTTWCDAVWWDTGPMSHRKAIATKPKRLAMTLWPRLMLHIAMN